MVSFLDVACFLLDEIVAFFRYLVLASRRDEVGGGERRVGKIGEGDHYYRFTVCYEVAGTSGASLSVFLIKRRPKNQPHTKARPQRDALVGTLPPLLPDSLSLSFFKPDEQQAPRKRTNIITHNLAQTERPPINR